MRGIKGGRKTWKRLRCGWMLLMMMDDGRRRCCRRIVVARSINVQSVYIMRFRSSEKNTNIRWCLNCLVAQWLDLMSTRKKMGGYCECLKYLSRCWTLYDSMVFPGFLYVDRAERKRRKKTFETLLKLANFYGSFFFLVRKKSSWCLKINQSNLVCVMWFFVIFKNLIQLPSRKLSRFLIISLQYTCMFLFNSFDLFQSIQKKIFIVSSSYFQSSSISFIDFSFSLCELMTWCEIQDIGL